jgi:hypothetical protein
MNFLKKRLTPRKDAPITCEISSLSLEPMNMSQLKSSRSSSASLATTMSGEAEGEVAPTTPKSSRTRVSAEDIDNGMCCSSPNNRSMGSGSFSSLGSVSSFIPSPVRKRSTVTTTKVTTSPPKEQRHQKQSPPKEQRNQKQTRILPSMSAAVVSTAATSTPVVFTRRMSSFLRVADLQMDETMSLHSDSAHGSNTENVNVNTFSGTIHPNFHHVAVNPPPGMKEEPLERWVVLDDGAGLPAPIASFAVAALAKIGLQSALDKQMWTAGDAKTKSLEAVPGGWHKCTWNADGCVDAESSRSISRESVLVWTGNFQHGHYGSQLPAVRTAGFIQMSATALTELLVDSSRCTEYNKLSVGRTDLLVLQEKMSKLGHFGGITKVMKSESRPPMLRKTLQFISILHATELPDGSGYLIVSRAVTTPEELKPQLSHVLKSEILMGVNIIKRVEGDDNRCLLVTVNHIRSPMVPMMIAKRIGLQAAVNFIQDLRACAAAAAAAATATVQE